MQPHKSESAVTIQEQDNVAPEGCQPESTTTTTKNLGLLDFCLNCLFGNVSKAFVIVSFLYFWHALCQIAKCDLYARFLTLHLSP